MTASAESLAGSAVLTGGRPTDSHAEEPRVPALAGGVQLLGEVAGSGYRQAPALVRRADGQTIQLTPLLYQLLSLVDGRRSYAELAAALSDRCGKLATEEDVQFLTEVKLRPLGLLRGADGAEPAVRKLNPLLGLRLKLVVARPGVTNWIAALFAPLFHLPVVLAVMTAFLATTAWIVFQEGLGAAAHQAIYEPAALLLVFGLILVSTAFHELGHAAACRFSGAKPGGIGVGLYLVWPAFYTDVTDAYRLGRGGRLRVDLGGLYFNAIFGVAMVGVWAATHVDAVLLVIVAQLVQMIRQLVPFVRFDGYHVLADLVGVPDLFFHIRPTLVGLLPWRWGRGPRNPLKLWARTVVTLWVLVTLPLLAGLLVLVVLVLPRIVATAWDSLGVQWSALSTNWEFGDISAVATGFLSMLTISLPVLGIAYLLARIVRRTSSRTWAATAGRPVLRVGCALMGAVLLAGITWAWWPRDQYRPIEANSQFALLDTVGPPAADVPLGASTPSEPTALAATSFDQGQWMLVALPQGAVPPPTDVGNVGIPPASSWPFPWDPPAPPGEGDNQALAVNTQDGSSVFDSALALVWVTDGGPVDQTNEAYALASCTNCETTAVSFQVIIVIGYAQVVTPENAAVAVNYLCAECLTQALAIQTIAMLDTMPDEQTLASLSTLWGELEQLSDSFQLLPFDDVYDQLIAAQTEILDLLGVPSAIAGETEVTGGVTPGGTTTTSDAPAAETGATTTTPEGTTTTEPTTTSDSGTTTSDSGTTTSGGTDSTTTGDTTTTEGGTTTDGGSTTTTGDADGATTTTEGTTTGEGPATTP
jgi:putative peptide zinc metalloprotease protein